MSKAVKTSKPLFSRQEFADSCLPACLRMVLSGYGLDLPEDDLRLLCETNGLGAEVGKAVTVVQQLGFPRTTKTTLTADKLTSLVARQTFPIVFVEMSLLDGIKGTHTLVVTGMSDQTLVVYDPLCGERLLPRQIFNTAWALQRNLALVIEK